MTATEQASEWRRGWPITLAGAVGMMFATFHAGALGVVMPRLESEFGWGRAEISASILIICIGALLIGPLMGFFIERFGVRRIAIFGVIAFALTIGGVAFTGPGIASWYIAWSFVGLVYAAGNTVVWSYGISRCFERHRGMALALGLSGVGISGFISPLITVAVEPYIGWRGVFIGIALVGLAVTLPLVWFGFHPDRVAQDRAKARPGSAPALSGYSVREVLKNYRFWFLALILLLLAAAIGGITIHFQPILRDAGVTPAQAAGYAAVIGPSTIAGRVVGGWFLDRYPTRYVATLIFLSPVVVCVVLLNYDGSPAHSILAAAALGVAAGAEGDCAAYMTAKYFGLRRYAVTYALLIGLFSFAFGLAPVIAGAVFDAMGSYDAMFALLIFGLLFGGVLTLMLGRPPEFGPEETFKAGGA